MIQHTRDRRFQPIALGFVFLWFSLGSVAHFLFTDVEAGIIPAYIPFHIWDVYISGLLEMLGALGLLWKKTRHLAGFGLVLLTLAVTPANLYMAMHWVKYPAVSAWILDARLVFQGILLAMIWWSTDASKIFVCA
jgi:uncharacterized membrane protein